MDIPRLVFQEIDDNKETHQVKPNKEHVYADNYYSYERSSPKMKKRRNSAPEHRTGKQKHWHKEKEDKQDVAYDASGNAADNATENATDNATDNATEKKENHNVTPVKSKSPSNQKHRPISAQFSTASMMPSSDLAADLSAANKDDGKGRITRVHKMILNKALLAEERSGGKDRNKDKEKSKHRHHHHHKKNNHAKHLMNRELNAQDTLESRLKSGMNALEGERKALREIVKEMDENIGERDREDITSHRFDSNFYEKQDPYASMESLQSHRHHRSGMLTDVSDLDTVSVCSSLPAKSHMRIDMDNQIDITSSTQSIVQLEELTTTEFKELQLKERARSIEFEEDVEKKKRWGKRHVASLSFQSLIELRRGLETGTVLLNLDSCDLPTIFESVVENLIITDQIQSSMREKVTAILLSKYYHHHQNKGGMHFRHPSETSMQSGGRSQSDKNCGVETEADDVSIVLDISPSFHEPNGTGNGTVANHVPMTVFDDQDISKTPTFKFALITEEPQGGDPKSDVKERIPAEVEGMSVLVAAVEDLERPAMAFVRLSKGCYLGNLTEVSIPVRFLFVIMGPPPNHDYFEIGRSMGTLMSDKIFHDLAYTAEKRDDILAGINSFLDDSIVLSPGDWDRHLLLPLLQAEISEKRRERIKLLKETAEWEDPDEEDPLEPTGHIFGGLRREVKKKIKYFKSDFVDGFNIRCFVALIFLFFATFAPTITFGAMLEKKTNGNLGVMETLLATSMSGVVFGLFSGQPLMILASTGPILIFEQATYNLSSTFQFDFLAWRVWIGIMVMFILWGVVAAEGCFLVKYFTRFTEEVFAVLISLLFVYEAIDFLVVGFKQHPLTATKDFDPNPYTTISTNTSSSNNSNTHTSSECELNNPNVALISTLLLLGTFFIAYYLRKLHVSYFFSSKARRVLADFSMPFAIMLMVAINLTHDEIKGVRKLKIKRGLQPTKDDRTEYFINPLNLPVQWMVLAIFPALCVSILLFMETELTGVVLNKRKNKLRKGGGYNMDLFIMGALCGVCSILGLPWMCAATVRSVQHQNALAIMSRSHAPGEKPYLLRIKEQRLTNIAIHVLIGIFVAAYSAIEHIPLASVYGVFLYLGITSLSGIQFIEQLKLIFVPSKYHPNRNYIRNVKYASLVWYTLIQVVCLIILLIVKLTPIAPAFPFVIIGMVFLRRFIQRFFTEDELENLDNEDDGDFDDFDEYGVSIH